MTLLQNQEGMVTVCLSLVTSQNDAAPKPERQTHARHGGLVTSQNDAAPKLIDDLENEQKRLVTSQNDAAPKPNETDSTGRFV